MTSRIRHIAIVGSGNTATYFGHLFKANGFRISSVSSRNHFTGQALADQLVSPYREIPDTSDADLMLLCVSDDELAALSGSIQAGSCIICHCAGSIPMDVLNTHPLHGVIYPLQSINKDIDMRDVRVPFLLEANEPLLLQELENLITVCGQATYQVHSSLRLAYHTAAVFANNFTNAMMMASEQISEEFHLDFNLLHPLLEQTFKKITHASPKEVQTGPARRNDQISMQRHLGLLAENKGLEALYRAVSLFIVNSFKEEV
jgi:predicted short-subunit dehydrogenase-like oxidoreductase (DUF2520 family)